MSKQIRYSQIPKDTPENLGKWSKGAERRQKEGRELQRIEVEIKNHHCPCGDWGTSEDRLEATYLLRDPRMEEWKQAVLSVSGKACDLDTVFRASDNEISCLRFYNPPGL